MSSSGWISDLFDESWQDMPVIRTDPVVDATVLDTEDKKKYHWSAASASTSWHLRDLDETPSSTSSALAGGAGAGNATGKLLDIDAIGQEWREKEKLDEMDYTRLELDDDPEEDEISMRTQYLFNEEKGMTPLAQMQATKTLLTEGQRIAYVGLCRLVAREMVQTLALAANGAKELEPARESAVNWANKIMGRLYRHMEVDGAEQRMIEQLAEHGVTAEDLVPSLATTYTVDNPEYDPDYTPTPEYTSPSPPWPPSPPPEPQLDPSTNNAKPLPPESIASSGSGASNSTVQHEDGKRRSQDSTSAEDEERETRPSPEEFEEERKVHERSAEETRIRIAAEEERGKVAREVARIERRAAEERKARMIDPFGQQEEDPFTSPKLGYPKTPPRRRSGPLAFDEDAGGDISGAFDTAKPSRSLRPITNTTPPSNSSLRSSSRSRSPSPHLPPLPSPDQVSASPSRESETQTPEPSTPRPLPTKSEFPLPPPPPIEPSPPMHQSENFLNPLPSSLPGVSKTLTAADKTVTLDIRWTILCDLFLSLIADSVYDARSRVLLGNIADRLGLNWMDVVRFERRLTEALEIQENVKQKEHNDVLESQRIKGQRQRYVMMGLATIGGGLVIGLSAGLLAPVIGAGLGAALTTVGVTGTTSFLAGAGGAAIISSGATISGSYIGGKAMAKRTRHVKTFEFQPLHNNKRVNYFITIPGFMSGPLDDVRLPFSTIDPVMGDVFSVLWEPDMMGDTGNALKILTSEVLTQVGQQVLALTVMTALLSALQWPMMLSKLGYLIDNPWSNALDRARQAGAVLADILINRRLGVRPVSLVGFSLGARVIFYALVEIAKAKAFGVVQEVYLFGATLTASKKVWRQVRGVVAGRFVNAFAMNDWVLGYLFRATSGGLQTVAGLRPIDHVPDLENVDITHILVGHMSYRTLMPQLLAHVGFKTTADHFDEPEEMETDAPDREVLTKEEEERRIEKKKRGKFGGLFSKKKRPTAQDPNGDGSSSTAMSRTTSEEYDLPPRNSSGSASSLGEDLGTSLRKEHSLSTLSVGTTASETLSDPNSEPSEPSPAVETKPKPPPKEASVPVGFDLEKLRKEIAALPKDDRPPVRRAASNATLQAPVVTDLTALDMSLDARDVYRQHWGDETPKETPSDPDEWVPPPLELPNFGPSNGGTTPTSYTFGAGGQDEDWKSPSPFRDDAPATVWGNESTTSFRTQNPW